VTVQTIDAILARAQGCLLGQLAGDSLGSLVEFQSPDQIRKTYPEGVRELADGGTWNTIAGQPTDDSEMALMLARSLVERGIYDEAAVRAAYVYWLDSGPFDCGNTVRAGLRGTPNAESQANGALMRISPLGIFGVNYELSQVAEWARQDAALTHPHPVCQDINALFAMALSEAIRSGCSSKELCDRFRIWAQDMSVQPSVLETIEIAAQSPPDDYTHQQGWVLIAFQNALWQLLHAPNLEEGVVDTVMRGGDTDTNAAICGALLGAIYGVEVIPTQWRDAVLNCRPEPGNARIHHPRPKCFWPIDALALTTNLVRSQGTS
jgi:ADP-ribosyl-[dinitrogen reductase] hydrolase